MAELYSIFVLMLFNVRFEIHFEVKYSNLEPLFFASPTIRLRHQRFDICLRPALPEFASDVLTIKIIWMTYTHSLTKNISHFFKLCQSKIVNSEKVKCKKVKQHLSTSLLCFKGYFMLTTISPVMNYKCILCF